MPIIISDTLMVLIAKSSSLELHLLSTNNTLQPSLTDCDKSPNALLHAGVRRYVFPPETVMCQKDSIFYKSSTIPA